MNELSVSALLGKTLTRANGEVGGDLLVFETDDGETYQMYHDQNCCENVYIESIVGDLQDLVGSSLLVAEEICNDSEDKEYGQSQTWTFYKFATVKGYVDIRWIGESNGYYS